MNIDNFTAEQLDELIARAIQRRQNIAPKIVADRPQGQISAHVDPAWYVDAHPIGALLQIRHAGAGWLSFVLPRLEVVGLLSVLLRLCLLTPAATAPPAGADVDNNGPVGTAGGGRLH